MQTPAPQANTNASKVLESAIVRGAYNAVGAFASSFLIGLTFLSVKEALIMGGIAACTVLGFRGGGEGYIDKTRAEAGKVLPSDVGAYNQPIDQRPAVVRPGDQG